MKTCSGCAYYSAIDPSAGNCRVNGAGRDTLQAATPTGGCGRHVAVANDDARVARAA